MRIHHRRDVEWFLGDFDFTYGLRRFDQDNVLAPDNGLVATGAPSVILFRIQRADEANGQFYASRHPDS